MERIRKNLLCAFLCVFLAFSAALAGCTPSHYTDSDKKAVEDESRKLFTEWLKTLPEECEIVSLGMANANKIGENIYSGYYLSHFSHLLFRAGGRSCEAIVNNETGQIWTDYYEIDLNKYVAEQLKPFCEAYGFTDEYIVTDTHIAYRENSHNTPGLSDDDGISEVYFERMLPAEITPENADEKMPEFLHDQWLSRITLWYPQDPETEFSPQIFLDYLRETRNYNETEYSIYWINQVTPEYYTVIAEAAAKGDADDPGIYGPDSGRYGTVSQGELSRGAGLPSAEYVYQEFGREEYNGLTAEYVKKYYDGPADGFDPETADTFSCPVVFGDDTVSFDGETNFFTYLFFYEEPAYTGAVRTMPKDEEKKDEQLIVREYPGHCWSFDKEESYYFDGFYLEPHVPQFIVLEKP